MKQNNQKLKCYLVYRYLLQASDENHFVSQEEIKAYLETFGIKSERRSIYADIEDINIAIYAIRKEMSLEKVRLAAAKATNDNWKTIVYDGSKKGYYVRKRDIKPIDANLIIECIYAAKFITENQAQHLANVIAENFVSRHQAIDMQHEALLLDRGKAINSQVFKNVQTIYKAIQIKSGKEKHAPEKISFKYLTAVNKKETAERRKGENYVVSPYKIIINDGNYYLLAFDDKKAATRTFRVDRMKDIKLLGIPRDSVDELFSINEKDYVKQHFGMFGGKVERVTIRFIAPLLDTFIDKFGSDLYYNKIDDNHFTVQVAAAITDQFFGWLCSFGKRVKLIGPPPIEEKFKEYLGKIKEMYYIKR